MNKNNKNRCIKMKYKTNLGSSKIYENCLINIHLNFLLNYPLIENSLKEYNLSNIPTILIQLIIDNKWSSMSVFFCVQNSDQKESSDF